MEWVYLSPHFDDAVLSCGGLIWEQRQNGDPVSIWTVCAGQLPPGQLSPYANELHLRWQASWNEFKENETVALDTIVEQRRKEDIHACKVLSASFRHFEIPDCIYRFEEGNGGERDYFYATGSAIMDRLDPRETSLVAIIAKKLESLLPAGVQLVAPLGLGNHVDHQLSRLAAERLKRKLWYYADFPYIREESEELERLKVAGWHFERFTISQAGLDAWQSSVAAYRSQISSFWPSLAAMREEVERYRESMGGVIVWQPPGDF